MDTDLYEIGAAEQPDLFIQLKKTKNQFFNWAYNWAYFDDYIQSAGDKHASFSAAYDYKKILNKSPALKLLNTKPADLQLLYNEVTDLEISRKNYIFFLALVKTGATDLLGAIHKQYPEKNE